MERLEIVCQCTECGRTWRRGEEADNETLCLRCERMSMHESMDELDIEYCDMMYKE